MIAFYFLKYTFINSFSLEIIINIHFNFLFWTFAFLAWIVLFTYQTIKYELVKS